MDTYLANQDYKATWSLQETVNSEKRPGMRGGHQLIIDSANSVMYLYGGWDGFEDLSDLWSYSIKRNSWTLIHERSEEKEGPSPRSCHKMVYDPHNAQIFTLGRYMDSSTRTKEHIKVAIPNIHSLSLRSKIDCFCLVLQSDFYLYDTKSKSWLLICDDTSQVGGPNLIFDHQMCIDISKRNIYVFGGRVLTQRVIDDLSNEPMYSGLFSYHIGTNTWTQILVDCAHPTASNPEVMSIKSRVTHSMLFHHVCISHTHSRLPSIQFHPVLTFSAIGNCTFSVGNATKSTRLTSFRTMWTRRMWPSSTRIIWIRIRPMCHRADSHSERPLIVNGMRFTFCR